jgi:hypothetical protein
LQHGYCHHDEHHEDTDQAGSGTTDPTEADRVRMNRADRLPVPLSTCHLRVWNHETG